MDTNHEMEEQKAKANPLNQGGKVIDPVLPNAKVDNIPGNERKFMPYSKVQLGTVPQRSHKVCPVR